MNSIATRCVALLTAVILFQGCFTYVPVEVGAVQVGQDVRMRLTREALREFDDPGVAFSLGSSPVLEGTLTSRDADRLMVRLQGLNSQAAPLLFSNPLEAQVPISVDQILQLESKEFHRMKTGIVFAGTFGAILLANFINVRTPPGAVNLENGPPDQSDEIRIPLFSLSH
jgi:hypothetical protein